MLKPLPPTLRERSRYVVLEFSGEGSFSKKDAGRELWSSVLRFLGELGASELNLWIIDWDKKNNTGIFKVRHNTLDDFRASIALIRDINGVRVIPRILSVSGTLKKARAYPLE